MFNIGIFILGITMTSMITGSITSMLANSDVSSTQRREKIYRIRKYMQSYRVPDDLADTIRGYYEYLWETNHRDEDLFTDLTDSLKLRLTIATKRHFIHNCSVFHGLDQFSVIRLIMALKQVICVPDEIVAAQGEIGTSMYFVAHGSLAVSCIAEHGHVVTVGFLEAGNHFGEAAILEPDGSRNATVRAISFCELFALKFDELFAAGSEDRAVLEAITATIHSRRVVRGLSKTLRRVRVKLEAYTRFSFLLKDLKEVKSRSLPEGQQLKQLKLVHSRGPLGAISRQLSLEGRPPKPSPEPQGHRDDDKPVSAPVTSLPPVTGVVNVQPNTRTSPVSRISSDEPTSRRSGNEPGAVALEDL